MRSGANGDKLKVQSKRSLTIRSNTTDPRVSCQAREASPLDRLSHKTLWRPVAAGQRRETRRQAICMGMSIEPRFQAIARQVINLMVPQMAQWTQ